MANILTQDEINALLAAKAAAPAAEPAAPQVLTQQETEALPSAGAGHQAASQTEGAPEPIAGYDFKHPARVNKDQLRVLERLHDHFARRLSSTFSGLMRSVVDIDTAFVDQTTYAEYIMSLSNPSCSYSFTLEPTGQQAVVDIAMPVAFSLVDRAFGGKGAAAGVEARQLTLTESGVITGAVHRALDDLQAIWQPLLPVRITDATLHTSPEFIRIAPASEIVILLAFEVNAPHAAGLISLCYPFFTLEAILPRLGLKAAPPSPAHDRLPLRAANRRRLAQAEVPLRVELGRRQISLAAARALQVGDVVVSGSHRHDPAVVFVGDEPKLLGRPCVDEAGHVNVRVAGTIPPELEEHYRNQCRPVRE